MIRILTKKKRADILKRLVANGYMFEQICNDMEWLDKYFDNELEIAYIIAGMDGIFLADAIRKDMQKKVE